MKTNFVVDGFSVYIARFKEPVEIHEGFTRVRDITRAIIETESGISGIGIAIRRPTDVFCEVTGIKAALKRALQAAELDRETRAKFWATLWA